MELLFCIFLVILSGFIISYNLSIMTLQRTPIQQCWLSIGVSFQFMYPIILLVFRSSSDIVFIAYRYMSLLTMAYIHLYITKFNVSIPKVHIKFNLIALNIFIVYYILCLIISILHLAYPGTTISSDIISFVIKQESLFICMSLGYSIFAICFSIYIDFFKVKRSVNIVKIFNVLYEIGLIIFVIKNKSCNLCFYFLSTIVILMEICIIKIICIDKGRYYNNDK